MEAIDAGMAAAGSMPGPGTRAFNKISRLPAKPSTRDARDLTNSPPSFSAVLGGISGEDFFTTSPGDSLTLVEALFALFA
jgi:hypothetical protein